jgi:hypothetical protein
MVMLRLDYDVARFIPRAPRAPYVGVSRSDAAPQLWIDGRCVVGEMLLPRSLESEEISLVACDSITVCQDGGSYEPWSTQQLLDTLSGNRSTILELRLLGSATVALRLRVERPDEAAMIDVEAAFANAFSESAGPDERGLAMFARDSEASAGAATYASALHQYVTSVLIKDRAPGTGAAVPFSAHTAKQKQSLAILSQFPERPLALVASGLLRFSLNDFVSWSGPSGVSELDDCSAVLRTEIGLPNEVFDRSHSAEGGSCPADEVTSYMLLHWDDPAAASALIELADSGDVTVDDSSKARVLARRLLVEGDPEWVRLSDLLVGDPVFGRRSSPRS